MPKPINMLTTIKGSLLENFYPKGWNLKKLDDCCALGLKKVLTPSPFWNKNFKPTPVQNVAEMDEKMGNAIADQIERAKEQNKQLAIILPVGPSNNSPALSNPTPTDTSETS